MSLAHERERHCLSLLLKKLKFSPIVSIQGPRQAGKSYLAKKILTQKLKQSVYKSLDFNELRQFAENNPNTFLTTANGKPFIIDEVQKVPLLFDELKAIIDEDRKPGQFLILGSTEFSHENQIRESLTGRLSRIRLFPLNLAETKKLSLNPIKNLPYIQKQSRVTRADLMNYLDHGGFPGIFLVRNHEERTSLLADWLNLTFERDIYQIKKFKLDSKLTSDLVQLIATSSQPNLNYFTNELRVNSRRIQNHLSVLKTLFVIFEVNPFKGSSGKTLYYLIDTGLLNYYHASFEKKLLTWFYLELQSQLSYKGSSSLRLQYYKSPSSAPIHFVCESKSQLTAIKLVMTETYDQRDYSIFDSLEKKYGQHYKEINCYSLYGGKNYLKLPKVTIAPWESLV